MCSARCAGGRSSPSVRQGANRVRGATPAQAGSGAERWLVFVSVSAGVAFVAASGIDGGVWLTSLIEPDPRHPFFADFLLHYWPAAWHGWHGTGPTAGFQYPPSAVAALTPLVVAGDARAASYVWAIVLGLSAGALAAAPLPTASRGARWALAAMVVVSVPVWHCVRWGQVSLPLTALAIWGSVGGCSLVLGWGLGAAIALKLYPVLLLPAVAFTADGHMQVRRIFGGGLVLGVALPVLVLGVPSALTWLSSAVASLSEATSWLRLNSNAQYLPHVARRVAGGPELLWQGVSAAAGVGAVVTSAYRARRGDVWSAVAIAWLSLPLLVPPAWPHYFVFLPWVLAVMFSDLSKAGSRHKLAWALSAFLCSVPALIATGGWAVFAHAGVLSAVDLVLLGVLVTRRSASPGRRK